MVNWEFWLHNLPNPLKLKFVFRWGLSKYDDITQARGINSNLPSHSLTGMTRTSGFVCCLSSEKSG